MKSRNVILAAFIALVVVFGLGYGWGAARRSAAESALSSVREQLDLSDARGRLFEARVSLYNNNFGDASRGLEEAKAPLRRLRQRYADDDRDDAVTAVDSALQHVDEAQRLAGKLDHAAHSKASDALEALKVVRR